MYYYNNLIYDKMIDTLTHRYTTDSYYQLKKSEYYSFDELLRIQLKKLRKLIKYAYNNNKYYHDLFINNNIHYSDIVSIKDIEKIPISDKQDFIKAFKDGSIISSERSLKYKRSSTGGTTGSSLILYKDQHDRSVTWGAYWRWYDWMGFKKGMKKIRIWGQPIKKKTSHSFITGLNKYFLNIHDHNSFELSEENIKRIIYDINHSKKVYIHGYTSSIVEIARYIKERSIEITPETIISTTAEKLTNNNRSLILESLKSMIFDQYGCGECGSLAFECENHSGKHVTMEHVLIENNEELYEQDVILTNLDNFIMPFIRYKNGDVVKFSDDVCQCGNQSSIIEEIIGRSKEFIYTPKKRKMHQEYFTHLLSELGWFDKYTVYKYQIVQKEYSNILWKISMDIVPNKERRKKVEEYIINDLDGLGLSFEFVENIENEMNGKYKYIKNFISDSENIW